MCRWKTSARCIKLSASIAHIRNEKSHHCTELVSKAKTSIRSEYYAPLWRH
jgi:hypothetical protein